MKLRILAENLTAAVTEATRAIAKRSSLPQGDCVLLETVNGRRYARAAIEEEENDG